jgi:hypothetical protein
MTSPPNTSIDNPSTRQQWHRLFGLILEDHFYGSPYRVEVEVDLARQAQFLDVVVVEQEKDQPWPEADMLPDGLENLKAHNLITFKSYHESFTDWTVKELIGHYVNYRKQISPINKLIPQQHFGLYAISNHYPKNLAHFLIPTRLAGVYQLNWGSDVVRLIVLSQIGPDPKNDLWHLFSHQREQVELACQRYHPHDQKRGTVVIQRLIEAYKLEYPDMAYTFEQFTKEFVADHLNLLSPDEVLKRYSPDERLKNLSPDEKLKDVSPDEIFDHLSPEALQRLLERVEQRRQH